MIQTRTKNMDSNETRGGYNYIKKEQGNKWIERKEETKKKRNSIYKVKNKES